MFSQKQGRIVFLVYFPAYVIAILPVGNAKFINDTFYYLYEIQTYGWRGIANSYHMIFLWQLPSLCYFLLYKIFGMHWLGWHIVFSALHALNAVLLFYL